MGQRKILRSDGILPVLVLTAALCLGGCTGSSSSDDGTGGAVAGPGQNGGGGQQGGSAGGSAPTVTLSASAQTIDEGGTATLSWTANGADTCTASGGWSGTLGTSGSRTVGPLVSGTTFTLSCSGAGGSALQMISVAVVGPVAVSWVAPQENVDGSQLTDLAGYRIYYGESSRTYSDMVEVGNSTATSHTLSLASGDYYVAMTALDADGNESGYSNEVIKTRL